MRSAEKAAQWALGDFLIWLILAFGSSQIQKSNYNKESLCAHQVAFSAERLKNWNPSKTREDLRAMEEDRENKKLKRRFVRERTLRHGRVPRACRIRSDLHLFPLPDPRTPQCCRFRKCSVAIAKSVSARLRARAAGIGPSIRFPRYKRGATTPPPPPSSLIALIYPQRLLIISPSYYFLLFAFHSHAVCRSSLSLSDLWLASLLARIFFPPFLRDRAFPVKFFEFLHDAETSLSLSFFFVLISSSRFI